MKAIMPITFSQILMNCQEQSCLARQLKGRKMWNGSIRENRGKRWQETAIGACHVHVERGTHTEPKADMKITLVSAGRRHRPYSDQALRTIGMRRPFRAWNLQDFFRSLFFQWMF
jgi:hypothetical protein